MLHLSVIILNKKISLQITKLLIFTAAATCLTSCMAIQLFRGIRVFLLKRKLLQLQEIPRNLGTTIFKAMFTTTRQLSPSSARLIQSTPSNSVSLTSILIVSSNLSICILSGVIASGFSITKSVRILLLPITCPMQCSIHPPWFGRLCVTLVLSVHYTPVTRAKLPKHTCVPYINHVAFARLKILLPWNANTGRFIMHFIMFSVITNIYNKKTKGRALMELLTATGKMNKYFFQEKTRVVRRVHQGWHRTHRYHIQVVNHVAFVGLKILVPWNANTGRFIKHFIIFSVITNIYNKKTKGRTLMALLTATGKLKKFFFVEN